MAIKPAIYTAKIAHKRLFPAVNAFHYNSYYLALPLTQLAQVKQHLNINTRGYLSFHESDHSNLNGSCWAWIRQILANHDIDHLVEEVVLVTMPRVLGYVFNPVSFWLCFNKKQALQAVLSEVCNTFGEKHHYLCMHADQRPIDRHESLTAEKLFHVSPFLKREGSYQFKFITTTETLSVYINFYNADHKLQLATSMHGKMQPLSKTALRKTSIKFLLVTQKTIFLIHWQAFKLMLKKIRYIPKPKQQKNNITRSQQI